MECLLIATEQSPKTRPSDFVVFAHLISLWLSKLQQIARCSMFLYSSCHTQQGE